MSLFLRVSAVSFCILLIGCVTPNELAMKVGGPPEVDGKTILDLRKLQTRRFDTLYEDKMLHAGIQTLQDLGFTLSESSSEAGVLVGSKKRDAEEAGQVAGQVVLSVFMLALGVAHNPVWDKEQDIFVNLVSTPIANSDQIEVRISFERRLTNNHGQLWRSELILEPEIHQEFFNNLSQSTFLEAHKI